MVLSQVLRRVAPLLLVLSIGSFCRSEPDREPADWRIVLSRKKAVARYEDARVLQARQAYVDALRDFCRRYPTHSRAREVYREVELEFARELLARGDYEQATRFFESALLDDPANRQIQRELAEARRLRFLTPETLERLRQGMRQHEVALLLGHPLPGWERTLRKGNKTVVSWYYRRADGGVGGLFFADGKLFAAEYDKPVRLRP